MIKYIEGDIFDSPAQVIVNTVNTVGVMGKGIALEFKHRYPDMFERYRTACEKHMLTIGKLMLVYEPDHWILLFPTKESWRNPSKLEYIEKGLMKFVNSYTDKDITSIAFPLLGCGNGELNWPNEVQPLMERYLSTLPIDVYIYLNPMPTILPEHKQAKKTLTWLKENAKDMSYIGIKEDIESSCAIVPYEIRLKKCRYSVKCYNGNVIFLDEYENETIVDDNTLYSIWDSIRSDGVFKCLNCSKEKVLVSALLCSMGYLSNIRILDSKSNMMVDGYQINEGYGRIYSLRYDV